jgi:hypothetical protein
LIARLVGNAAAIEARLAAAAIEARLAAAASVKIVAAC